MGKHGRVLVSCLMPAALLLGCAQGDMRAPAARSLAGPTSPVCPNSKTVNITNASPPTAAASASIRISAGQLDVGKSSNASIRWKFTGGVTGYAFTNDGIAFSATGTASAPPSGVGAPMSGNSEYAWCIDSSGSNATWYYTIKLTTPTGTTWSCDPTIVNSGSQLTDDDPKTISCNVLQ